MPRKSLVRSARVSSVDGCSKVFRKDMKSKDSSFSSLSKEGRNQYGKVVKEEKEILHKK